MPEEDLRPILMGLYGEVGSIMAPAKKRVREREAYPGYLIAVEEEFGDALWYLCALARRIGYSLPDLFSRAGEKCGYANIVAASDTLDGPLVHISSSKAPQELDDALFNLGTAAAALLILKDGQDHSSELLHAFVQAYLHALQASKITFSHVVQHNILKTRGRFIKPEHSSLPNFDRTFAKDEQLPHNFQIKITQKKNGQSYLQWNGVFIGDPLTDSIFDSDGYRFHDVFHFAHAAVLHWSPTFRALIKHKRKSDGEVDRAEDGGRAIVVEEGLTAWLFARAKQLNFFENQAGVSFDLLKTVQHFVQGYEVEACPLWLWENAILQGYEVFRQVRANEGGLVICDRTSRSITFQPLA